MEKIFCPLFTPVLMGGNSPPVIFLILFCVNDGGMDKIFVQRKFSAIWLYLLLLLSLCLHCT